MAESIFLLLQRHLFFTDGAIDPDTEESGVPMIQIVRGIYCKGTYITCFITFFFYTFVPCAHSGKL